MQPFRWTGIALVMAGLVSVLAAGVLFLDGHARTGPRFCALCHVMESHVVSYLSGNYLDNVHYQANVGCQDCHTDHSLLTESKSVWYYLRGEYEEVFSRRVFGQEMCTRCHISMEHQADRTDFLAYNPHLSHWPGLVCGDCHLAHDEQIDYCATCHDNGGQRVTGEAVAARADNPWADADITNQALQEPIVKEAPQGEAFP